MRARVGRWLDRLGDRLSFLRPATVEGQLRSILVAIVIVGSFATFTGVKGYQVAQDNSRQDDTLRMQAHEQTQQNVRARFDDCHSGDRIRRALYAQAVASGRTTPLLLRLVPSLDTPEVRALVRASRARQLRAFKPRGKDGCIRYALRAVPPEERPMFQVP